MTKNTQVQSETYEGVILLDKFTRGKLIPLRNNQSWSEVKDALMDLSRKMQLDRPFDSPYAHLRKESTLVELSDDEQCMTNIFQTFSSQYGAFNETYNQFLSIAKKIKGKRVSPQAEFQFYNARKLYESLTQIAGQMEQPHKYVDIALRKLKNDYANIFESKIESIVKQPKQSKSKSPRGYMGGVKK